MYRFFCSGHPNILSTHKSTLEFTKDRELTLNGDCILGVDADFKLLKLKKFIDANLGKRVKCEIIVDDVSDSFSFDLNPKFLDKDEIVIRKTKFESRRTLGFMSDKAAADIDRKIVEKLKDSSVKMEVRFKVE